MVPSDYNSHPSPPSSPSPIPSLPPSPPLHSPPSLPLVTQRIHCPFQPKQSPSIMLYHLKCTKTFDRLESYTIHVFGNSTYIIFLIMTFEEL